MIFVITWHVTVVLQVSAPLVQVQLVPQGLQGLMVPLVPDLRVLQVQLVQPVELEQLVLPAHKVLMDLLELPVPQVLLETATTHNLPLLSSRLHKVDPSL